MNNLPGQMLRRIVAKHGKQIGSDSKRCESLLNDLCGSYRREINVLVIASEEGVPLDLLKGAAAMPLELLLTRLEKRLEDQTAMTAEAASWAVESWALALGMATEVEIEARTKRVTSAPPKTPPIQPPRPGNTSGIPSVNRPTQMPPPPRTPAIIPPTRAHPPMRAPTNAPTVFPANTQANNQTNNQTINAPTNQTAAPRRSFGFFRGCLVFTVLLIAALIVLFLGVPYAIETMRETQRERNSEPPRFPVR